MYRSGSINRYTLLRTGIAMFITKFYCGIKMVKIMSWFNFEASGAKSAQDTHAASAQACSPLDVLFN